jgi:DNA mismatch repair protein MutS2
VTYPENFEQKTGFERIREKLSDLCFSSLGRKEVSRIRFQTDKSVLEILLSQTEEFRQIILNGIPFPGSNYYDPEETFRHLRLQETFAEPEVLLDIKLSVTTILKIISLLSKTHDNGLAVYPALSLLSQGLVVDPGLTTRIDSIIDEKAEVRSGASPKLSGIRKAKHDMEVQASRRINQLLTQAKSQGFVAQDVELALRNGRQVIPVSAAYKRKIRGFVHDHSATGQTVFLEPEEVFELNNQIRELEFEERQEIIRILKGFADYLRPMIPMLNLCYTMLGNIDAIRAKARLALEMEAFKPRLAARPQMRWVNARHPLLFLSYKALNKHVEPFTIELDEQNRILIISGPNAGGKSVCLKSCGLIQYMLQCGLLVPLADYSEAGIYHDIFIDIGDEQSLENDLSTYSSHLKNMTFFVNQSGEHTLFLIDEFGTGTEPRIGGAIAEAVLEALNDKKAFGVITTHYANLKILAGKHPGMVNGSMLFDTKHMKPLFRLKTGNPGSSFAFEIAKTIGLPDKVLDRAAGLAGSQDLDFDRQLQDLELKKIELEQKERQLRSADGFLSDLIDKYQALHSQLEERKTEIILKARQEAKQILGGTNKIIEKTIRDIKESQARQEETREARKALDTFSLEQTRKLNEMEPEKERGNRKAPKKTKPQITIESGPIVQGDPVRITGQQAIGEVLEISGMTAMVSYGNVKLKTPLTKLEKISKGSLPQQKEKPRTKLTFDINEKAADFKLQLDIRGMRAEDALARMRTYTDDCILLSIKQVKILHGKGDGILRMVVREFLRTVDEVNRYRDEHPDRGGAGATIVDFR